MAKRLVVTVMLLMGAFAGVVSAFQPAAGQGDFEPVSALPKAETLPAGAMLVVAYSFVWIALVGYVWTLWRRSQKLERDIVDLERRAAGR